jgi:hypothetical protein
VNKNKLYQIIFLSDICKYALISTDIFEEEQEMEYFDTESEAREYITNEADSN